MDQVSRDPCDCGECEFCEFSLPPRQKSVIELMAELGPVKRTVTIGHYGCTCQDITVQGCQVCELTEWSWEKCNMCHRDNIKCTCSDNIFNIEKKKEYYALQRKLFGHVPESSALLQNLSGITPGTDSKYVDLGSFINFNAN